MKTFRKRTGKNKDKFKEQDEFLSLSQKVLKYAQGHTKQVYVALLVAAVVVILTILVSMLFENSQKKVMAMEDDALKYYDINSPAPGTKPMAPAERLTKARDMFKDILDNHGSGPVAVKALYYKANADMELGNMDAAIEGYKKLLEKASADPMMAALANKRLAEAYLAKGNQQEAINTYLGIAKAEGGYLKDEAHFRLAKIYDGMGKKDEALAEYKALEKDFPDSPFISDARKEVARLTGVPEVAVPLGTMAAVPVQAAPAGTKPAAVVATPALAAKAPAQAPVKQKK